MEGWISAVTAHLIGDPNHFHPRLPSAFGFRSLYDLGPMRRRLARLIDFGRINGGDLRLSIAATDVCSGDPVIFDTHREPIALDHLMASCGFLPEFAPVTIGARTLVDGGLSLNAPFDPILAESGGPLRLFVLDLYARDDQPPASLEAAFERKNDLLFGNQTYLRLKDKIRIRALERSAAGAAAFQDEITLLSYRAGPNEPGPEKSFNFSRRALAQRWQIGFDDMMAALAPSAPAIDGLRVIRRSVTPPLAAALRPAAKLR
ncbi:patatin-like phospholipase family protein [Rhodopseudomonas sp. BR0C11]|uniref:patatin-like phospholipase family protein n=1 Tax=Rhodopseudomonas sp. BR0C11 TaxID=2269370 RepID=UPI0013DE9060|nr:patatin-like phospholipase family protein [Rhodopseudomonas sp. BR0C11]NEV77554.1 patatin-like phospholipase family protein [Rhodopseudomonas sp. BR0C11]